MFDKVSGLTDKIFKTFKYKDLIGNAILMFGIYL